MDNRRKKYPPEKKIEIFREHLKTKYLFQRYIRNMAYIVICSTVGRNSYLREGLRYFQVIIQKR
ncbi:MAG: hypothetical protein DRP92_08510 [Candidatus Neomarinimicrobiota bacterium]|nr:MAG: hypothetical protein DRP92_08510 [Candidatus Neomarinimicrobiota bacterium]